MSHPVLALGTAATTLAGSVWWLPAVADLRAGDDRPRSTRLTAAAVTTLWSGLALTMALLLAAPGIVALAASGLGAAAATVLRVLGGRQADAEQDEARRLQFDLAGREPTPLPDPRAPRRAVRAWLLAGLAATAALTLALLQSGGGATRTLVGATGAGLLALLGALLRARAGRRALMTPDHRPSRGRHPAGRPRTRATRT